MILIADSGSTKTDWRLILKSGEVLGFKSKGLNPYFHTIESLNKEIAGSGPAKEYNLKVSHLFFYCAGCSSVVNNRKISGALRAVFKNSRIEVNHDLLGAARAVCGKREGMAAILGTGSNSCFYDGKNIVHNIPALGYVFGDEGSGAYMGKLLIGMYLNSELPQNIYKKLQARPDIDRDKILRSVYNEPLPNRYLASYTRFIGDNLDDPFMHHIVHGSISDFFDKHICKYKDFERFQLGCVGSIAHYFKTILTEVAEEKHVQLGQIVRSPIELLVKYHKE